MKNVIARFNTPAAAINFVNLAFKTTGKTRRIIMGDDMKLWIVTMAEAERLIAGGLEELPNY